MIPNPTESCPLEGKARAVPVAAGLPSPSRGAAARVVAAKMGGVLGEGYAGAAMAAW